MARAQSVRIHPTAVISPEAELADDVVVGPHVVIEGPVRIGRNCAIRACIPLWPPYHGSEQHRFSGAVLGERPQHLKYNGEPTGLEIGDGNIFREHVTIHRGTTQAWTTRIGSHNFFMVNSHVAHDCQIGNRCILANGALVGGHCTVEDNVYLSGNCAGCHQFVRVGRLALLSGCSASTKDIPPFVIQQGIDTVVGVNVIGMRRAGVSDDRINAVRRAFRILFLQRLVMPSALARIEQEMKDIDVVEELVSFIRRSSRGINPIRNRRPGAAA